MEKIRRKTVENTSGIECKRIWKIMKNKLGSIALLMTAFLLAGYWYSFHAVIPTYQATATLLLIPNETAEDRTLTSSDLTLNSGLITTYSNIAKQSKVLKQVIQNLGLTISEEEFAKEIQVKVLPDTYIIEMAITDQNPEMAKKKTEELAKVFLQEIQSIYHLNNIGMVDQPVVPTQPNNIHHKKDIVLFAIAGTITSGIFILGIYLLDNTIKTEEDIEEYTGLKTLGKIPVQEKAEEIIQHTQVKSFATECINTIRTNILYMNSVKKAKTIVITSCMPQEGKSFTAANLAVSFAEANQKVLLIDADMRKGRISKIFHVPNEKGLSQYLLHMTKDSKENLELGREYIQTTQIANLHILTNGILPPNPSELIGSPKMHDLLALWKQAYDVIILDAPPCKLVTDSVILSTIVDSVILIARANQTKLTDFQEVVKSIRGVKGNLIGGIVNQMEMDKKAYGKGYYYGHSNRLPSPAQAKQTLSVEEVIAQAKQKLENSREEMPQPTSEAMEQEVAEPSEDFGKTLAEFEKNMTEKLVKQMAKLVDQRLELLDTLQQARKNNQEKQQQEVWKQQLDEFQNRLAEKIQQEMLAGMEQAKTNGISKQNRQVLHRLEKLEETVLENIQTLQEQYTQVEEQLAEKEEEENGKSSNKIIDLKLFNREEKVYSIEEEIPYLDLEKMACYVIPFTKEDEQSSEIKSGRIAIQ